MGEKMSGMNYVGYDKLNRLQHEFIIHPVMLKGTPSIWLTSVVYDEV